MKRIAVGIVPAGPDHHGVDADQTGYNPLHPGVGLTHIIRRGGLTCVAMFTGDARPVPAPHFELILDEGAGPVG